MQQHPVPQPITSYEFRLVGDMTLKQFGKLAAGIILALITYGINPPGFIKWPLILLFVGIGAAMAFVPFEGRPIDIWIVAFFKRIYSPTLYFWQSKSRKTSPLANPTKDQVPLNPVSQPPKSPPLQAEPPKVVPSLNQTVNISQPNPSPVRQRPVLPYIPKAPPSKPDLLHRRVEAMFVTNMTIPAAPTMPNIIVGYVHTPEKKIIDGAIVEIRDPQGNPVRALKTNQMGQFQTATPLPGGTYEIELEKEGYNFDIIRVNLEGKPIPPIEIISKG